MFSKTIRKILAILVTNPEKRFYLRQLSELTSISLRPVQLALKRLVEEDILYVQKQANIKFYLLNKKNPIYPEIKSIILKTEAVGEVLKEELKNIENIKCAFIYGSVAKNKERKSSDIDLCIVGEVNMNQLSDATAALEEKIGREVNVVTFSEEEWEKAVLDKKAFVLDLIKNKKVMLIGEMNEY